MQTSISGAEARGVNGEELLEANGVQGLLDLLAVIPLRGLFEGVGVGVGVGSGPPTLSPGRYPARGAVGGDHDR
jgi:hypothetical protein